jgi:hypothetical protein
MQRHRNMRSAGQSGLQVTVARSKQWGREATGHRAGEDSRRAWLGHSSKDMASVISNEEP